MKNLYTLYITGTTPNCHTPTFHTLLVTPLLVTPLLSHPYLSHPRTFLLFSIFFSWSSLSQFYLFISQHFLQHCSFYFPTFLSLFPFRYPTISSIFSVPFYFLFHLLLSDLSSQSISSHFISVSHFFQLLSVYFTFIF